MLGFFSLFRAVMFPIGNVGLDLEADVHQNWRSHT